MEEFMTAFLIACSSFLVSEYLLNMLEYFKLGKLYYYLDRKPFNCPMCLSIWIAIAYTLTIDLEFIYYIAVTPIFAEGISRHLLEYKA